MRGQPRGYSDFQRYVHTRPEREFELLELPIQELPHPVEVPNLVTQYKYHSNYAILNSLPVPIRVVWKMNDIHEQINLEKFSPSLNFNVVT